VRKTENGGGATTTLPPVRPSALHSDLAVCVWIPRFALRCEEQRRPETAEQATVLLAPDDLRRLWQVGSRARHSGVRPGMTVSQAVGLCPSLAVWEPDPVYYDELFSQLVKALGNVSPAIEPAELGRVFVGVDGLAGLYGSPEKQIEAIRAVMGTALPPFHRDGTGRGMGFPGSAGLGPRQVRRLGGSDEGPTR